MFYAIFFRNMGLGWPLLYQSWIQISFVDLEKNLDGMHVNNPIFKLLYLRIGKTNLFQILGYFRTFICLNKKKEFEIYLDENSS